MSLAKNILRKNISSGVVFNNDILEHMLNCVEKGNEVMNQFLIETIYRNWLLFKIQLKKISLNHFVMQCSAPIFLAVENKIDGSWEKHHLGFNIILI